MRSRLEQRTVIKSLMVEKCKPCGIYRTCDVNWEMYEEAYFSKRNKTVNKWAKHRFATTIPSRKKVYGVKTQRLTAKENIPELRSIK